MKKALFIFLLITFSSYSQIEIGNSSRNIYEKYKQKANENGDDFQPEYRTVDGQNSLIIPYISLNSNELSSRAFTFNSKDLCVKQHYFTNSIDLLYKFYDVIGINFEWKQKTIITSEYKLSIRTVKLEGDLYYGVEIAFISNL